MLKIESQKELAAKDRLLKKYLNVSKDPIPPQIKKNEIVETQEPLFNVNLSERGLAIKTGLIETYFTLNKPKPNIKLVTLQAHAIDIELAERVDVSEIAAVFKIHRQNSSFIPDLNSLFKVWKKNPAIHKAKPLHHLLDVKTNQPNAEDHYRVFLRLRELSGAVYEESFRIEHGLDKAPTQAEIEAYRSQCMDEAKKYPVGAPKRAHFENLGNEYPPKEFRKAV